MSDVPALERWITETEGENLEFKSARNRFDFEELTRYAVALANEGGGKIILGVTDDRPRQICGSQAFTQPERTRAGLIQRLHLGIDFDVIMHPDGRVLVFHVPSRPRGIPVQFNGRYLVRDGDSLVGMPGERLREIYAESGRDFSAEICSGLGVDDLSEVAIENFRQEWIKKSQNNQIAALSKQQLLSDIEVTVDGGVTYAGLILFGTREIVRRHLAQAEFVFEYRGSNAAGPAGQREEFTEGFFLYYESLWELVNRRNDNQHYQDGMSVLDIPTFSERAVREAILNAVSHRNYELASNIFLRQYPGRIEIDSPGGFAPEITPENILYRQSPRNRRIAEVFALCGLVERAGQGIDLMYQSAIRDSKQLPDFSRSDANTVSLRLEGSVLNKEFVRFVGQIPQGEIDSLSTDHWLILDLLSREEALPESLESSVDRLIELGVIVRAGKGRFILGENYYKFQNREDTYNRLRENESRKETLEKHIQEHAIDGSPRRDLLPLVPGLNTDQLRGLLDELRDEGRIHPQGEKRGSRWFPGPEGGES